jgi:hypothetical protein
MKVIDWRHEPVSHFFSYRSEKRACTKCEEHGVTTAAVLARIAPKSIFADETIIEFILRKYADSLPLFRQQAMLRRDAGIDVALSTINDAVLRVGELLIPVVDGMARDLLTGGYIQADETYCGVQTQEKKGENHRAWFWQYSAPGLGVVFDFEMTRAREVPRNSSRTMAAFFTPMAMRRTKKMSATRM